jgi:uncharacterized protein
LDHRGRSNADIITVMTDSEITDNTALHRFELQIRGETAFLLYERTPSAVRLIHTEVPGALREKGVGSRLVAGVLNLVEQNGLKVIPLCPFVIEYLKRHPERLDIVDEKYKSIVQAEGSR